MPLDAHAIRPHNAPGRLAKPDGRTREARRYRDLLSAFSTDLGEPLSATADQLVRRLVGVSLELEAMDRQRAAGGAIDPVNFTRLVGIQRRLLSDVAAMKGAAHG